MKSRSVVDLITSGVDVSGTDEYCRPGPSTKTATITGSSATRTPDFLRNLIAPPILVLTNDQEKKKKRKEEEKYAAHLLALIRGKSGVAVPFMPWIFPRTRARM